MRSKFLTYRIIIAIVLLSTLSYCDKYDFDYYDNVKFNEKLSDYNIFQGDPALLKPSADFLPYDVATPLFSDYSDKYRLLHIPAGKKIIASGDGLPEFPDGTILVKTFYYQKNLTDPSIGIQLIETRLLIKKDDKWNAVTYLWNKEQTDALYVSSSVEVPVNWVDKMGEPKVISYHVPGKTECSMCHGGNTELMPIGVKMRNLNRDGLFGNSLVNQLQYLNGAGVLEGTAITNIPKLPSWNDNNFSLEQRARAYMDVNCGHCHSSSGLASDNSLKLTYETPLAASNIERKKSAIRQQLSRGSMPMIGTTMIDKEGLKLVVDYLESLK